MAGKDDTGLEMKYFILKPKGHSPYADASRQAMMAYAAEIEHANPTLAKEIKKWVCKEELPQDVCGCGYCDH